MRSFQRLVASLMVAALTACSGGGIKAAPQPAGAQQSSIAIRVTVPSKSTKMSHRNPAYVSSATQSITVSVSSANQAIGFATFPCSNSTCGGTLTVPNGDDTFTVVLYDGYNASGNVLSRSAPTLFTIEAGVTNTVSLTFNPVLGSIADTLGNEEPVQLPIGTPASTELSLQFEDADGNTIVGPGSFVDRNGNPAPVTVSTQDEPANCGAHTSPATTTFTSPMSYADNSAVNGAVTFSYDGGALNETTISISSPAIASPDRHFTIYYTSSAPTASALHAYAQTNDGIYQFPNPPTACTGVTNVSSNLANVRLDSSNRIVAPVHSGGVDFIDTTNSSSNFELGGASLQHSVPGDVAFDSSGNLYVLDLIGSISEFSAPITSASTPQLSLDAPVLAHIAAGASQLAFDSSSEGQVKYYALPLTSSSVPTYLNASFSGTILGMAFDNAGHFFVAHGTQTDVFATPLTPMSVPEYSLPASGYLNVDSSGNLYVGANSACTCPLAATVFSPPFSSTTPSATIPGDLYSIVIAP